LARFSDSIIALMIKSVPVAAVLGAVSMLTANIAFSNGNRVFQDVFARKVNAPEVWVCGIVFVLGVTAAVAVARRERRVDVA
jgi:hypothetical protein